MATTARRAPYGITAAQHAATDHSPLLPFLMSDQQGSLSVKPSNSAALNTSNAATLAANLSAAGGGTIVTPAGLIDISSSIPWKSKVIWDCISPERTHIRSATRRCFMNHDNVDLYEFGARNFKLSTLVDDGVSTSPTDWVVGIDGPNVDGMYLEGLRIEAALAWANAIFVKTQSGKTCKTIRIRRNRAFGRRLNVELINHDNGTSENLTDIDIEDNYAQAVQSGMGISVSGYVTGCRVHKNLVDSTGTTTTGIEIAGRHSGTKVFDNWFRGNFSGLIVFSATTSVTGIDNEVTGNQTLGRCAGRVFLSKGGAMHVADNVMRLSGSSGFEVSGTEMNGTSIVNNRIDNDGGFNACLIDGAADCKIDSNFLKSSGANNFSLLRANGVNATGNIARGNTFDGGFTSGVDYDTASSGQLRVFGAKNVNGTPRRSDFEHINTKLQGGDQQIISSGSAVSKTLTLPSATNWCSGILTAKVSCIAQDGTSAGYASWQNFVRYKDANTPVSMSNTEPGVAETGIALTFTYNSGSPGSITITATSTATATGGNTLRFAWDISFSAHARDAFIAAN